MATESKLILGKLIGFSTGEISKSEIYEWALYVVVSSEYEKSLKHDKLTEQIFQFLIDIEKPKLATAPTKKILQYFIDCLEDRKNFSPDDYKALMDDKPAATAQSFTKQNSQGIKKNPAKLTGLAKLAKIYALIFVTGSILLNTAAVIKPDLLVKPSEIAPSAFEVRKEALPHLIYGILILVAMSVKVPRIVFYGFIPVGIWGMFFYWSASTSFGLKHGLSLLNVLLLLFFVALPPTAAFFVLLTQWFNQSKKHHENQEK